MEKFEDNSDGFKIRSHKHKYDLPNSFEYKEKLKRTSTTHLRKYSRQYLESQLKNTKLDLFQIDLIRKELRTRPKGPRRTKPKKK